MNEFNKIIIDSRIIFNGTVEKVFVDKEEVSNGFRKERVASKINLIVDLYLIRENWDIIHILELYPVDTFFQFRVPAC